MLILFSYRINSQVSKHVGNRVLDNVVLPPEQDVHNALEATLSVTVLPPKPDAYSAQGPTSPNKWCYHHNRTSLVLTVPKITGVYDT